MACFLSLSRKLSYASEMRLSALKENLLRSLRSEIAAASADVPSPLKPFADFAIDARPGEQWVRLNRTHRSEHIKIDATMIDGAAAAAPESSRHISLIVEASKGDRSDCVLQFVCSAWPDALEVENVFPLKRGTAAQPFLGPAFRDMDEEMKEAVVEYLEERGVNDGLAEFLHGYMESKEREELVRWFKNVEAFVKK